MQISTKTSDLVASLDSQIAKRLGYRLNPMREAVANLDTNGHVEIGWRESCGKTDPTIHEIRAWRRIVASLRKDGNAIAEEPVKHKNAYATNHGGFWKSIIFSTEASK